MTGIPYCPRCGLEVGADADKCPRCGTMIPQVKEAVRPGRAGAVEHLRYAVDAAKKSPKVFIPGAIGAVFTAMSGYLVESWDVYQDFMAYIWRLLDAQMGIIPASYASGMFDYTRFVGWVPVAVLFLGLLSWASTLASIRVSWGVLRGEEADAVSSYRYVAVNLVRFAAASLYTAFFSFAAAAVYIGLIVWGEAVGFDTAMLLILLFTAAFIVVVFLVGPVYIVMVGEDVSFVKAVRLTVGFTRRRAATYFGISLLLFLVMMALGVVPWIGLHLSFVVTILENLAVGDLYSHFKLDAEW